MAEETRLYLLPQASEALDQIYDPLFSEIAHRIRLLKRFPKLGRRLAGRFHGWRGTVVGPFRVIYRLTPRGVEVGHIRHCKRRPPSPPEASIM